MMFILTLKNRPEGVFSVINYKTGDNIIPIFESEDDIERYQILLEEDSTHLKLDILEIDGESIISACEDQEQKYAIITEDDFIIPPQDLA